jgi:hypothetical protein
MVFLKKEIQVSIVIYDEKSGLNNEKQIIFKIIIS